MNVSVRNTKGVELGNLYDPFAYLHLSLLVSFIRYWGVPRNPLRLLPHITQNSAERMMLVILDVEREG